MFRLRLKELRENKNISQYKMADELGMSQSTIGNWEAGKREPDFKTMQKLADYFDVTVDYLLGRAIPRLPDNAYYSDAMIAFPIIGTIKAGYGGLAVEEQTGEVLSLPIEMLRGYKKEECFVFQVKGNSMYPKILNGDKVLVHKAESVDSGATAVVLYNGNEATIKRVRYNIGEDWLELIPENPEYETLRIEGYELEQCKVIGQVIKLIRDV